LTVLPQMVTGRKTALPLSLEIKEEEGMAEEAELTLEEEQVDNLELASSVVKVPCLLSPPFLLLELTIEVVRRWTLVVELSEQR